MMVARPYFIIFTHKSYIINRKKYLQLYFLYCNENLIWFTHHFPGKICCFGKTHPGNVSNCQTIFIQRWDTLIQIYYSFRKHQTSNQYEDDCCDILSVLLSSGISVLLSLQKCLSKCFKPKKISDQHYFLLFVYSLPMCKCGVYRLHFFILFRCYWQGFFSSYLQC